MTVALYRHYNKDNVLLYVGISNSHLARLHAHVTSSGWKSEIAFVKVQYLQDRIAALAAEKEAIQSERPLHNIVHNKPNQKATTKSRRYPNVSDEFMEDLFEQIDLEEMEDCIDDYNNTRCSEYQDYCVRVLNEICAEFGVDFDEVVKPQLAERNLPVCNNDCPDCIEAG